MVELHNPGKVCEQQGYPTQFNMGPSKAGDCSTNSAAYFDQFKRLDLKFIFNYICIFGGGWGIIVMVGTKGMFM